MTDREHSGFDYDEIINRREVAALKWHPAVVGETSLPMFAAGVADMDFRSPGVILDAMQHRLNHGVFGYEGVPDGLMQELANWMARRHGWSLNTEHVLRAPNVLNSLATAVNLFTRQGEGVIVQPPVFFDFFDVIRENHRNVVHNPLRLESGRYVMDFDDLEQKASQPEVGMLMLCNPHNPVGRAWNAEELATLGEICASHGVMVVSDEMHCDLVLPGHSFTPFASLGEANARNSVTCLSPAKTFNIPACSAAFTVVSNDEHRSRFQAENSRLTVNKNNSFANVAMMTGLQSGEPWLEAVTEYLAGNIELVRYRLNPHEDIDLIQPESTFLIWLDCRGLGRSMDDVMQFLRDQAGWVVNRGDRFGNGGDGFVRVNIACSRRLLQSAMDRLVNALSGTA